MSSRLELARVYWRRIKVEGIGTSLRRAATHPGRILHHVSRLASGNSRALSNRYTTSPSRSADVALVARALRLDEATADGAIREIETDEALMTELRDRYRRTRSESADGLELGRWAVLYALARLSNPRAVIETGVHDGLSTALILRALDRNGSGSLTSIDLPSTDLPPGVAGPGWLVPDSLKGRWTLLLGDSRKLLPQAAASEGSIDIFLHDSDHSRAHREFEFRTVREFMAPDGLIVSDDDQRPDTLLDELAAEWSMIHLTNQVEGSPAPVIGLLVR